MESFNNNSIIEEMRRYIGQTVTIFTTSGGLSGTGFTGVLIAADCNNVKLLCSIGWAPSCPLGSNCVNSLSPCGINNNSGNLWGWGRNNCSCRNNPLGSVTIIPTCAIASFTHNAI